MLDNGSEFMIMREDPGMFVDQTSSKSILCINCMHENPPDAEVCEKCEAELPPAVPPPRLEDLLVKLKEAVSAFHAKEIPKKEFESFLISTKVFLEKKLTEVEEIEIPEDFKVEMQEEMDNGKSGIKALIQAFSLLEQYVSSGNSKFLDEGLSLAEVGTDQVNRAMRLNWEKFQAFRGMVEDIIKKSTDK